MKINTAWISESEKAHGENWRAWLGHLKDTTARGLELGTFMGESAEWMLTNIFTHPKSQYVCVDTFGGSVEHHVAGIDCSTLEADTIERLAPFGSRVEILRGFSHDALAVLRSMDREFEFVYVDAAHDSMNVLRDAVFAFDVLVPGGVMIFDDYTWKVFPHDVDCPRLAIDSFVACYARQIEVIGMGAQLAIRKLHE